MWMAEAYGRTEQTGNLSHSACGKDDGRSHRRCGRYYDNTDRMPTRSSGHDAEYRAQTSGTQTERAFAVVELNRNQCFLSGTHDERQDHDRQRHRTRPAASIPSAAR